MTRAPHRLCFSAAALVWTASALAWALQLGGLTVVAEAMRPWPSAVHALVFALGAMPLFIAGFLFTAGPKWLRVPATATGSLVSAVALVVVGWLLVIGASGLSVGVLAAGLLSCASGWTLLVWRLLALCAGAQPGRRFHFGLATISCACVTACLWTASGFALADAALFDALPVGGGALDAAAGVRALARAGLWFGVLPVFVVATDRMLPFLSHGLPAALERVWPRGVFWIALSATWAGGAAALLRLPAAASPDLAGPQRMAIEATRLDVVLAFDAALVCLVSVGAWHHWRRHRAARGPMVAALLRAFAWWVFAWAALVFARLPVLDPALRSALDSAALHALGLGYLGGTLLAMVTRVTAAQAGRPTVIDRRARRLEGVLQLSAAARVLAALLPLASLGAPADLPVSGTLVVAAMAWAAVALIWSLRHGRVLVTAQPARGPLAPHPFRGGHRARPAESSAVHVASVDR